MTQPTKNEAAGCPPHIYRGAAQVSERVLDALIAGGSWVIGAVLGIAIGRWLKSGNPGGLDD